MGNYAKRIFVRGQPFIVFCLSVVPLLQKVEKCISDLGCKLVQRRIATRADFFTILILTLLGAYVVLSITRQTEPRTRLTLGDDHKIRCQLIDKRELEAIVQLKIWSDELNQQIPGWTLHLRSPADVWQGIMFSMVSVSMRFLGSLVFLILKKDYME